MDDKPRAVQRRKSWLVPLMTTVGTLLGVLLLYLLSYGPACDAVVYGELDRSDSFQIVT